MCVCVCVCNRHVVSKKKQVQAVEPKLLSVSATLHAVPKVGSEDYVCFADVWTCRV